MINVQSYISREGSVNTSHLSFPFEHPSEYNQKECSSKIGCDNKEVVAVNAFDFVRHVACPVSQ